MPLEPIEQRIYMIRGHKVMLDSDLADLYGATTKVFNQAVRRNRRRFPKEFMFQLTAEEASNLRSQFVTSSLRWGGRRYQPYVFTEHGALMAANVLNTDRAIDASVYVIRAFVKIQSMFKSNRKLAEKLQELEARLNTHDDHIVSLFDAIRQLMGDGGPSKRKIGFKALRQ